MWRSININKQNIKVETSRAFLIACPHNSEYDGYCFWHPTKLVKKGKHSYALSILYKANFTFNLMKYGKDKYNRHEIIDSIQLGYDEIEEVFSVMNENISAPQFKTNYETHKPQIIAAEKVNVIEELKDE